MVFPGRNEYLQLATRYGMVPVWEELPLDLETPVSLFQKVVTGDYAYLLESVTGGEQVARYSFIGYDPFLILRAKGDRIEIIRDNDGSEERGEPLQRLGELLEGLKVPPLPGKPRFFGGAVGYLGYDLVRHFERLPEQAVDDLKFPDCFFLLAKTVLIYDHVRRSLMIASFLPCGEDPAAAYEESVAIIERVVERIGIPLPAKELPDRPSDGRPPCGVNFDDEQANITRQEFLEKVRRAKEYIRKGDIFQVVLSLRFRRPAGDDSFLTYRMLRNLNPSPYMFYLKCGDLILVGSSPEMLVRCENGIVETHPIAGTRPRGEDAAADEALARELEGDPKERAEHVMLVDLGRNDLGRVCEYGSVAVTRFMENERYSHVMHLVSEVRGKLAAGRAARDALIACFPAGTVSGAPKVRAMEIIEELEPTRRGPYAGAVGYFSFNGNLDTCIAIRTIAIKDGWAYVQSGAGIVADSNPEQEYRECVNKAGALLHVLELAGKEGRL
ncbi:MAG: anthranilate synthase component [Thermacetogenium sp.]|nr:anthranilate synthase component [Thermacetogenium sp.]